VGSGYIGTCVPAREIAPHQAGKLLVHRMMSSHPRLDGINEGFDRWHEGRPVRRVINFPG
jgi:Zn-dependent alcohol dehydrogenase